VITLTAIAPREAVSAQESFVVTVAEADDALWVLSQGQAQARAYSGSTGTLSDGHER
jgi:hypothetical protein